MVRVRSAHDFLNQAFNAAPKFVWFRGFDPEHLRQAAAKHFLIFE